VITTSSDRDGDGRVGWVALAAQDELTVLDDRLKTLRGEVGGPSLHVR